MSDVSNYQAGMVDVLDKGLGALERPLAPGKTRGLGWRLLAEEVSLPAAVLYESTIQHNLRWMQSFVEAYGLRLAPHGKTTMAPKLFRRQIEAGAWGITVATAQQAKVAAHHGVQRVLMANQLVGKRNIAIVAELLEQPGFTFYCLVDSVDGVEQLARELAARGAERPMPVLLEVGPTPDQSGSRTGVSDAAQLEAVLAAVQRHAAHVRLAGVELYEGVLKEEGEIRVFLRRSIDILQRIASGDGFGDGVAPILSGAGSAWYDVVAEEFAQARFARPVDLVLRPGCYLTHDVGIYRAAQNQILQRNPVAARMREGLKPALQLWAYVQSIPRGDRAVIALGKRDAAFDSGYPEPALHFRPGSVTQGGEDTARPVAAPTHWKVTGMMDQHAYMTIAEGDDLRVGDMVAFDISHPCLTFDKWRHLLLLDDDYRCIDLVETFF